MPFLISNDEHDQFIKGGNLNSAFKKQVLKYLEEHLEYPAARTFHEYLVAGGDLATFPCQDTYVQEIKTALFKRGVLFLTTLSASGQCGFIIQAADILKSIDAIEDVLKKRKHMMRVVPGKTIRISSAGKNREAVIIGNLSKLKASYFKRLIRKRTGIKEIGYDEMTDGTCRITIDRNDMRRNGEPGIHQLLLETELMFSLDSKDIAAATETTEMQYSQMLDRTVRNKDYDLKKQPVFLTDGVGNYIKYNGAGVEYGKAVMTAGDMVLAAAGFISMESSRYQKQEAGLRAAMVMPRSVSLSAGEALEKASFAAKNQEKISGIRDIQSAIESKECVIAEKIDDIIATKMSYSPEQAFLSGGEYMDQYRSEVSEILEGINQGSIPEGYPKEEVIELSDFIRENIPDDRGLKEALKSFGNTEVSQDIFKGSGLTHDEVKKNLKEHERTMDGRDIGDHFKTPNISRKDLWLD